MILGLIYWGTGFLLCHVRGVRAGGASEKSYGSICLRIIVVISRYGSDIPFLLLLFLIERSITVGLRLFKLNSFAVTMVVINPIIEFSYCT